jgi:hypothetical protein
LFVCCGALGALADDVDDCVFLFACRAIEAADVTGIGATGAACVGAMVAAMRDVAETIGLGTAGAIGAVGSSAATGAVGFGAADTIGVGAVGLTTLGAIGFGVAETIGVGAGIVGIGDTTINGDGGNDTTTDGNGAVMLIGLAWSSASQTTRKDDGRWRSRSSWLMPRL